MHTYQAFFKNKRIQVQSDTTFGAQQVAASQLKVPEKKRHLIHVYLVQKADGQSVTQVITS